MTVNHITDRIRNRLKQIYGRIPYSDSQLVDLVNRLNKVKNSILPGSIKWDEKTMILITYGDGIVKQGEKPLTTLNTFIRKYRIDCFTHLHILPFFPYSSDDGFSVINYTEVDPGLGSWEMIQDLGRNYDLMFDLVINHISRQSEWFRNYCRGIEPDKDFFIETDPGTDLSAVIRPRALPLLTAVDTTSGTRYVWTTFSDDQIDLNFRNPEVLLKMIDVFLLYLLKGARIIRLDAIAFLWKETGTSCLHLSQTHEIVKLLRDITNFIDPTIILLTETNVPEVENISYFGKGDEAAMVYQFSLPPLLLHALITANSTYLNRWAASQPDIPEGCTYLNFTASHDGIGVRPLEGILPEEERDFLIDTVRRNGGYISTKRNNDSTESPYELNITYLDALKDPANDPDEFQILRFLCSQTLMMSFKGIPAFYLNSLLGTPNDQEGVSRTGMFRSINRHKWNADDLSRKLNSETDHSYILSGLMHRISLRQREPAFHPDTPQSVIPSVPELFIMSRGTRNKLFVLANLSAKSVQVDTTRLPDIGSEYYDLLGGMQIEGRKILLRPYQVCWLKKRPAI